MLLLLVTPHLLIVIWVNKCCQIFKGKNIIDLCTSLIIYGKRSVLHMVDIQCMHAELMLEHPLRHSFMLPYLLGILKVKIGSESWIKRLSSSWLSLYTYHLDFPLGDLSTRRKLPMVTKIPCSPKIIYYNQDTGQHSLNTFLCVDFVLSSLCIEKILSTTTL